MKKNIIILFTIIAISATSCKKDFLNLNDNPNNPVVATPNLLLSGALKTTAAIVNGGGYTQYANWMGYLSWSTGYQANLALESYQFTTANYDVWTSIYLNNANYNALFNASTEPYYQAIAKIMLVYNYQALVDNYNNVPYSQAGQGIANLNPTYDNGSVIYDDLLKQIDAAIVLIQKANPVTAATPGSADIMYQGNMNNWLKFANTLKLRLALRQTNVTAKTATLKAAITATASIGYIDGTNGATVNPGYLNSDANGGQQSPLWINYGYTQNGGAQANNAQYQANTYSVNFFTANGDPRLTKVYQPTSNGTIGATPFGGTTPPSPSASKLGSGVLKSATMNANVLSSASALFLQSEAVVRGYISGDAQSLYNAGVTASFIDDALTATQATAYYSQTAANAPAAAFPTAGTTEQKIQAIIVQKWAALNVYGAFEAFNEYRRTGYPNNIPLSIYPGANAPIAHINGIIKLMP
ncbi:MAG: SusD/RagB family nutrient-binding outer membrane lipoprotein [Sphingobacteriaceae bacterium]|nr:MAG: SusD/RagB family nutrient-binding outer membrane lipoprotein [Sphingobacteriaceae bacterium]